MDENVTPRKATSVPHSSRTILASSGLRAQKENDGTKKCPLSVIHFTKSQNSGRLHPTEKPVDLYKYLIERYSNEGDTVLDPTFGSCNSGLACKELKRKYIGCEMNTDFFNKGVAKMME
jgi:site-specific DNA-methyltransferase (adenine-specific)